MGDTSNRQLNIEILRIICMIMVVTGHAIMSVDIFETNNLSSINNMAWFMNALVNVAVNCYFLITGYFGEKTAFRFERILSLWLEVLCYSAIISVLALILGADISAGFLVKSFLPVTFKRYWFMQTYIALALLRPFINKALSGLGFRQFTVLMSLLLVMFSLHQSFVSVANTMDSTGGYGIIWAVVMYCAGVYVRRYQDKLKINRWCYLGLYIVICAGMFLSEYLIVRFGIANGTESRDKFFGYNSISTFLASVSFFMFWILTSVKAGKGGKRAVLWLSKSALAVYLISAHPVLFSSIWTDLFMLKKINDTLWLFPVMMGGAVLVYVVCVCIDRVRSVLFRPLDSYIGRMKPVQKMEGLWDEQDGD